MVFDLSERGIVPIVSRVKTDPARTGRPLGEVRRMNGGQDRLDGELNRPRRIAAVAFVRNFGGLFGRSRSAGREWCMDRTGNIRRAGWLLTLAMCAASGCQTVKTPEEKIASSNIPSEFKKVSMPDYVVEPPDLVLVEVLEALPGRPISGERLVRPDGKISLGFYGDVYVAGLTIPEMKEKIVLHLRKFLTDEVLGLVETRSGDQAGQAR